MKAWPFRAQPIEVQAWLAKESAKRAANKTRRRHKAVARLHAAVILADRVRADMAQQLEASGYPREEARAIVAEINAMIRRLDDYYDRWMAGA
ncbi:hypothetical protein [Streptomyces sp. NBC_00316]|uniref:hypothetical protein n=1 Tax=Streptomyces sp. NBC_00316 TaxID=2975710 RepID=UPI002E297C3A|nr:hypothetical protein [Streptomyces sp. NBC_00316]